MKKIQQLLVLHAILCITISLSFVYAQQSWQSLNGPFRPHAVYDLATSSTRIYATDVDTFKISINGGITWFAPSPPSCTFHPIAVACVTNTPDTAIVAGYHTGGTTDGICRTTDGGQSWNPVGPSSAIYNFQSQRLAISPTNPNIVFLGVDMVSNQSSLWKSTDGGVTWGEVSDFRTSYSTYVNDILFSPADGKVIVAGSHTDLLDPPLPTDGGEQGCDADRGIFVSSDGGATWTQLACMFPQNESDVTSLTAAIDVNNPNRWLLFAATETGTPEGTSNTVDIYMSTDNGSNWTKKSSNPPGVHSIRALRASPGSLNPLMVAATDDGLFESFDQGTTWSLINLPFPNGAKNMYQIAFDPNDVSGNTIFIATGTSVYKGVYSPGSGTWAWNSSMTGSTIANTSTVAASNGTLFAVSSQTDAIYKYSGGSWAPIKSIKGFSGTAVAVSTTNSNYVYVGGSVGGKARLYYSTDGGTSWSNVKVSSSFVNTTITTIVPDAFSGSQYVYAAIGGSSPNFDYNYAYTRNMGTTWTKLKISGINSKTVTTIAPDISAGTTRSDSVFVGINATEGIWKSSDGGESYSFKSLSNTSINSIAFNSVNSNVAQIMYDADQDNGVRRSSDYGQTWSPVPQSPYMPLHLLMDPFQDPSQMASTNFFYILAQNSGLQKTTDGGNTISPLDPPPSPLNDIRTDVVTGYNATLYVATQGGVFKATAPSSPGLQSPANNTLNILSGPVTLTWSPVTYVTGYTIQISTSSSFTSYVVNTTPSGTGTSFIFTPSAGQTYYWRIWANNATIPVLSTPAYYSFSMIGTAPGSPALQQPANNSQNIPCCSPISLTWSSVQNVANYTIQVSTAGDFSSFVVNTTPSGTSTSYSFTPSAGLTYYWRIYANNIAGSSLSTPASFTFSIANIPPPSPTLQTPANNTNNIGCTPVTLTWSAVTNVTNYTIQISISSSFTSFVVNTTPTGVGTSYAFTNPTAGQQYYWRIYANNNAGSTLSTPASFNFTMASSTLTAPTGISPTNGATGIGCSVTLSWNPVTGACSYHLTAPNVNQDITSNSYYLTGLTKNTQYNWSVYAKNFANPTGQTTSAGFTTGSCGPPPGCCPYVFTFDGKEFSGDNNILPQSEYPGNRNKDVTDYYQLQRPMQEKDGVYLLQIREFEHELSLLDQFKLIAIDHPATDKIAVLPDGEIVEYKNPFNLENVNNDDQKFTDELKSFDGNATETSSGQDVTLNFNESTALLKSFEMTSVGGVLLGGWTEHNAQVQCIQKPDQVGNITPGNSLSNSSTRFTFRERPTLVYVPLDNFSRNVIVHFIQKVAFDYANLVVRMPQQYQSHELGLISATHSRNGNILGELKGADQQYAKLIPGEMIELKFKSIPLPEDMKRDFILVSCGSYKTIKFSAKNQIPVNYRLEQNYPNPFNPSTTIRYELPQGTHVLLRIFNSLGQEVSILVNEYQDAGYKSTDFDASKLPNGVYFYRLQAGTYSETKKMLLMK